jgi:hypothetical protein
MTTTPGSNNPTVVRPAGRDNFHWWFAAENVIKEVDQPQITEILEKEALRDAQTQKRRCEESHHPVGTMYASSGLRVSADHWILDWALVKLDPHFALEKLQNVRFFYLVFFKLFTNKSADPFAFQSRDI